MNYKKTLISLALVSGVIASGAAQASSVTYDMGALGSDGALQDVTLAKGTFTDFFNFNIAAPSEVATSVQNHAFKAGTKNVRDISGLTMAIFNTNGTLGNMLDDTQIGSSLSSGDSSFDTLSSGNYYAKVTGNATGTLGGHYSVQMVADPIITSNVSTVVPVPAAAWLLGSGLLGLVGMTRRKQ